MIRRGSAIHKMLSVTAFPTISLGAPVLGLMVYESGMSLFAAAMAGTLFAVFTTMLFEALIPYRQDWQARNTRRSRQNAKLNLIYWISSFSLNEFIVKLAAYGAIVPVVDWVARTTGSPLPWPHDWPLVAQVILLFVVSDFFVYWFHRLMHEHARGWALHRIHHSVDELNWTAAARMHPLEHFVNSGPRYVVLIATGVSPDVLLTFLMFNSAIGFSHHSNVDTNTRWLDRIIYTPWHHRFHHSQVIRESNSNYVGPTLVWDYVFGTLYLPGVQGPANVGLLPDDDLPAIRGNEESGVWSIFGRQLLAPFQDWADTKDDE